MSTELIFAVAIGALAVIFLGIALIARSMREKRSESPTPPGVVRFKDCYELSAHEPGRTSESFTTMCTTSGGA